jgi:hypothetical protein
VKVVVPDIDKFYDELHDNKIKVDLRPAGDGTHIMRISPIGLFISF